MSTVKPPAVRGEYRQDGVFFAFKSKNPHHLSVKIFRGEGCRKITFTAEQLKPIDFEQSKLLYDTELGNLLIALLPPLGPEVKKGLLKPLTENPMEKTESFLFEGIPMTSIGLSESDPQYRQHANWYKMVDRGLQIQERPEFIKRIAESKARIGLQDVDDKLGRKEKNYLDSITRGVKTILTLLKENKAANDTLIVTQIKSIEESVFQLLIIPILEVQEYIRSPHAIFLFGQLGIRKQLEDILPKDKPELEECVSEMCDAIEQDQVEIKREELTQKFPQAKGVIEALALKADEIVRNAKKDGEDEINKYLGHQDVGGCLTGIFSSRPHLAALFEQMVQGRYSSLGDIPRGFSNGKIHEPPYLPQIGRLYRGCSSGSSDELKECCEEYLKSEKIATHYQGTVVPLIKLLQSIDNLLLWPFECEPSRKEGVCLDQNLCALSWIGSTPPMIPYEYFSIGDYQKNIALLVLKKKGALPSEKREAYRVLLHSRIPWKALHAIGTLLFPGGDTTKEEADFNKRLAHSALMDIFPEFPRVKYAMQRLLEFEQFEFSKDPLDFPLIEFPTGFYSNIQLLGNFGEVKRGLKKLKEVFSYWKNPQFRVSDYGTPKVQYALLRTIQILGEIAKILRCSGLISEDVIWDQLEELRDLLSHPERMSVYKRLLVCMKENPQSRKRFSDIFEDFRTLSEYFSEQAFSIDKVKSWAELKQMAAKAKKRGTHFDCRGIGSLYSFLAARIPVPVQEALKKTALNEDAKKKREEMRGIRREFLNGDHVQETYEGLVEKLPLNKNQKKEVKEAIKIFLSSKAAENNARDAKKSILSTCKRTFEELKKKNPHTFLELEKHLQEYELLAGKPEQFGKAKEALQCFLAIKDTVADEKLRGQLEKSLILLGENVDQYKERKKGEFQEILESIHLVDEDQIDNELDTFITNIQCKLPSLEDALLILKGYGIEDKDCELWKHALERLKKKAPAEADGEKEKEKDPILKAKKVALNSITAILDRIQKIDQLFKSSPSGGRFELFKTDKFALLACEYLFSDFRFAASTLEMSLETIRHSFPAYLPFFRDIQGELKKLIEKANGFLHVHEVTEPSTITPSGHTFLFDLELQQLLLNFSLDQGRNLVLDSVHQKLLRLEGYLKGIT